MEKKELIKKLTEDIFKTPKLKKEKYTGSKKIDKKALSLGYIKINAPKRNNNRNC